MVKILLFGKGGQVGWELQRSLAPLGEIIALDADSTGSVWRFHRSAGACRDGARGGAGCHRQCGRAYRSGQSRERTGTGSNHQRSWRPGVLAEEAKRSNALLVHYSTDYVFDGSGDRALGRDRCNCSSQCLWRNQAGRRKADSAIGMQASHLSHQLGVWRARRQLRQDHAAPGGGARQPVRHQRSDRRTHGC